MGYFYEGKAQFPQTRKKYASNVTFGNTPHRNATQDVECRRKLLREKFANDSGQRSAAVTTDWRHCDWFRSYGVAGKIENASILLRGLTEVRTRACGTLRYGKKYATSF